MKEDFLHAHGIKKSLKTVFSGDAAAVEIANDEIDYLCRAANQKFTKPVRPEDVVWSFAGVRPLVAEEESTLSGISRDYQLLWTGAGTDTPMLTVHGGKITTYRKLAEQAVQNIATALGQTSKSWTSTAPLPGGDLAGLDFECRRKKCPLIEGVMFPRLPNARSEHSVYFACDRQTASDLAI